MKFRPKGQHMTTGTLKLTGSEESMWELNPFLSSAPNQLSYLGSSHPICPMMPSIHIRFSRTTEKNWTLSVTEVT